MSQDNRRQQIDQAIERALANSAPAERMAALYNIANRLYEAVPYELAKQIEVYSHLLLSIGELQAAAKHDVGKAEADRKRAYGTVLYQTQGNAKEREGQAEEAAYPHRLRESEANAEYDRWRQAFSATQELVHAKKQTLNVLMAELNFGKGVR